MIHAAAEGENITKCACGECENYIDFVDYRDGIVDLDMCRVRHGEITGRISVVLDVNSLTALMEYCKSALEAAAEKK
jgi:hypothetical protein